jgi:hypothetical protein
MSSRSNFEANVTDLPNSDAAGATTRARVTPYELVFTTDEMETRVFPGIQSEAERAGVDPLHHDRFQLLAAAGQAVRDVVPAEAPPEAVEQYRALLYHAFNFWRFQKRVYLAEPAVARFLVEAAPRMQGWEFQPPHPSIYLQLPANLFWASISPDSKPEPVDGFFATVAPENDPMGGPYQRVHLLMVLGIRRDRAGFSVIPLDTEAGPGIPAAWAEAAGRQGGRDFENILPGGEISGLYSILTTTEVLKLAGRLLWYVDRFPADVLPEATPERREDQPPGAVPAPHLPYHRVVLGDRERP